MRIKPLLLIAALGFCSASAMAAPLQGYATTVGGRVQVQHEANGIRLSLDDSDGVDGFVPFDNKSTFSGLDQLDGREVQITGVVDGKQQITLTDPEQIRVME